MCQDFSALLYYTSVSSTEVQNWQVLISWEDKLLPLTMLFKKQQQQKTMLFVEHA